MQENVEAMQEYVEAIRSVVASARDGDEISRLCTKSSTMYVPRPDAIGTIPIKAILLKHPHLFELEKHNQTGYTVRLAEDVTAWTRTVHLAKATQPGEHGIADATVSVAPDVTAMNAYIESIRKRIARADTDVALCDLNQPSSPHFVARPNSVGNQQIKSILQAHPEIFELENHGGSVVAVRLASAASSPAAAPSTPAPRKVPDVTGRASVVGKYTFGFVNTEDHLVRTCELLNNLALRRGPTTVAIACKGAPEARRWLM